MHTTTRTYFVVGTYADGVVRRYHLHTTQTPEEHRAEATTGLLPFATVEVEPCDGSFTCSHPLSRRDGK